jgi:monoamine oxidase
MRYCFEVMQTTDVLIVGAGTSGLRVAELLCESKVECVVLEARDRVGGRLLSTDQGIDLGASWFWENEPDVISVNRQNSAEAFDQYLDGNMMFQVPGRVERLDGNPLGVPSKRIVGGMQTLTHAISRRLPAGVVHLSTPVIAIDFDERGATVDAEGETWRANRVVLALPPATAINLIEITPELPEALVSVARKTPVWMGAVTKVVAVYQEPFWRKDALAGSAMSHVGPMREIHDLSDPNGSFGALFGFSREPVNEVTAIAQLTAIFGPQAASPLEVMIKDWSKEKYTSPPGVFQLNDYHLFGSETLRSPHLDGRLYFTSTETALDAPGHIQGALSAAARCASALVRATV